MAKLDQTDFRIALSSVQAEYNRAKSEYSRSSELVEKGHISRIEFDKVKAQYKTSSAQLKAAKQDLKYTELRSSFAGLIAKRYVENFEEVNAKQEIMVLHDITALQVKISISETVMRRVKKQSNDYQAYATFSAIENRKFPLSFREIATLADEHTQTYLVSFIMQKPTDITLLPGMSTTVKINKKINSQLTGQNIINIPAHAVLEDSGGRYVFIAIQKENDKTIVKRRSVEVGQLTLEGLQIKSGLKLNDRVIVAGMSLLSEGLQVRFMDDSAK